LLQEYADGTKTRLPRFGILELIINNALINWINSFT
jgi:hypothetical protein